MPEGGRTILGTERLTPEERKAALEQPGTPWKEWVLRTFLKPWFALLLLILDGFLLATLVQPSAGPWRWAALPTLPALLIADYFAYQFLFANPPEEWRSYLPFHRTLRHPVVMGILHPDYKGWKHGKPIPEGEVPPEEFI